MKPAPVLIKKYGNRRLYDSSNSQYKALDGVTRHWNWKSVRPTSLSF